MHGARLRPERRNVTRCVLLENAPVRARARCGPLTRSEGTQAPETGLVGGEGQASLAPHMTTLWESLLSTDTDSTQTCGGVELRVENASQTTALAVSARLSRQPGGPAALALPFTIISANSGAVAVSVAGGGYGWAAQGATPLPTLSVTPAPAQLQTYGFPLIPSQLTPNTGTSAPAFLEVTLVLVGASFQLTDAAAGSPPVVTPYAALRESGGAAWDTLTSLCFTIGTCGSGTGLGFVSPAAAATNWPRLAAAGSFAGHGAFALSSLAAPGASSTAPASVTILLQDGATAAPALARAIASPAPVLPARVAAVVVLALGCIALVYAAWLWAEARLRDLPARHAEAARDAPAAAYHAYLNAMDSWAPPTRQPLGAPRTAPGAVLPQLLSADYDAFALPKYARTSYGII